MKSSDDESEKEESMSPIEPTRDEESKEAPRTGESSAVLDSLRKTHQRASEQTSEKRPASEDPPTEKKVARVQRGYVVQCRAGRLRAGSKVTRAAVGGEVFDHLLSRGKIA